MEFHNVFLILLEYEKKIATLSTKINAILIRVWLDISSKFSFLYGWTKFFGLDFEVSCMTVNVLVPQETKIEIASKTPTVFL